MKTNTKTCHATTLADAIIQAMWIKGLINQQEKKAIRDHCEKTLNSDK